MPCSDLTRSQISLYLIRLSALFVPLVLAGPVSLPAQAFVGDSPLRVPVFLELQHKAENVPVPLGPGMTEVRSSISITARGSGRIETDDLEFVAGVSGGSSRQTTETVPVSAFFDIFYDIQFTDNDSEKDFIPELTTAPGKIRVRQLRGQSSRLQGSDQCLPDPTSPNLGCVPQILMPGSPILGVIDDALSFQDISFSLGSGLKLSLPERDLQANLTEQFPLAGSLIFTDGFESGDTSRWSVSDGASTSEFEVAATGTLEVQEKVVIQGSQLTNYISLIGDGSVGGSGAARPQGLAERDGMKFKTSMIFTNAGQDTDLQIQFFSADNVELIVKLKGLPPNPIRRSLGSVFNARLGAGQALSLETEGLGDLQVGYARFTAGPSVGATAVFSLEDTENGITLYDAGIPAISRPLRRFSIFLDSIKRRNTGLAMVRVGSAGRRKAKQGEETPNVRLRLFDTDFRPVGTTSFFLAENHQLSRFIYEYFEDQPEIAAQAQEMEGVVLVDSRDPLAAMTLRLIDDPGNPTLTTFPVVEGIAEASMMTALKQANRAGKLSGR